MPTKNGMGGHGKENFDPATGKFIEDGKTNVRHPNPAEAQKIAGGVSPQKIQQDSASTMSAPTPNLGRYAEPGKEPSREEILSKEFGVSPKEDKIDFDSLLDTKKEMWDDYIRPTKGFQKDPDLTIDDVYRIRGESYVSLLEDEAGIKLPNAIKNEIINSGYLPETLYNKLLEKFSESTLDNMLTGYMEFHQQRKLRE